MQCPSQTVEAFSRDAAVRCVRPVRSLPHRCSRKGGLGRSSRRHHACGSGQFGGAWILVAPLHQARRRRRTVSLGDQAGQRDENAVQYRIHEWKVLAMRLSVLTILPINYGSSRSVSVHMAGISQRSSTWERCIPLVRVLLCRPLHWTLYAWLQLLRGLSSRSLTAQFRELQLGNTAGMSQRVT